MTAIPMSVSVAADRIEQAMSSGIPTRPVRELLGSTDIDTAYAVQRELTKRRTSRGAQEVGRKVGLTSPMVQRQLGVDRPDFGVLFDDMEFASGDHLSVSGLIQPKIEAEVAFVLCQDLAGHLTLRTVRAAVEYATPALEIVDSRIADWDITIVDTIADNASSAMYVLGDRRVSLDEFRPDLVEMSLRIDDELVSAGDGTACLGDPLEALLWLGRAAQMYGAPLRSGQVVLSGALGPMVSIVGGNYVHAEIHPLGVVSVRLTDEEGDACGERR